MLNLCKVYEITIHGDRTLIKAILIPSSKKARSKGFFLFFLTSKQARAWFSTDPSSQPKPILFHVETAQINVSVLNYICTCFWPFGLFGFFSFLGFNSFLVQESITCVKPSLPQDSAVASGTERGNIKCCIREFQNPPFHRGTYNGTTQETSEWQKQLSNLKAFTMACLQEDPS